MKIQREDGLLLEAKITFDGEVYRIMASIEESEPFCYAESRSIDMALSHMAAFKQGRVMLNRGGQHAADQ